MRKLTLCLRVILGSVIFALILSGAVTVSHAQKINRNHPSVYLTFDGFVKKTADEAYASKGARLVLHNNTKWPIQYGKWLDPVLHDDVAMIYTIELEPGCRDDRKHVDVMIRGELLSGRTVSFVVPKEDLPKNSEIYCDFNYHLEFN